MARERLKSDEETEASLLDRRSYLKLAGTAAATVVAGSGPTAAAESGIGYGADGYGQIPYGGSESTNPSPVIERFDVTKSEQLGAERMFSVRWTASDSDGDLDTVEIVVADGTDVNFSVQNVSGENASGWELFQFPMDRSLDVSVRAKDSGGNVTKDTTTITL